MAGSWRALAALLLLLAPAAALAEERILRFESDVAVQADGTLDVTETIDVRAENVAIRHGIYRDFPTRYRGRNGAMVRVGFAFAGATLDGRPVPATTAAQSNGVRIRVGDPDSFVPVGEHRFVVRYRTTRQIGRFEGFDELYWNATGNGWMFPIDEAQARIRLPKAARFGQRAAYTGPQGSRASDAEVVEEKPGEIAFRTTRPLGPYEGLTVAAAFPKGVVGEPGEGARARWWLADNGPPLAGLAGLIGLLAFYYVAWRRAGRDPRAGTVVPLFSPPDGLSPAAMRFISKMASDNRTFAAALVAMGVKGHVRMVEEDGGWLSRDKIRLERLAGTGALDEEEEAALRELARTGESIVMEQKNHAKFSSAKNSLAKVLKERYEGRLFHKNWGWAIAGGLLLVGAIWLAAAAVVAASGAADPMMVGTALGALVLTVLLVFLIQHMSAAGKCLLTMIAFVSGAGALALGAPIVPAAFETGWWLPMALPLFALPLAVSAFFWIDAPTREGRAILDRVAGFRHYLSITERERLDRMHPPEDTPELFERYLPYAIALGVENRWAERFAGVLSAAAAAQGRQGFHWYSGSSDPWDNPSGFASSVGSSLASTISSASTAPGSGSGSGGGGSSGGGGGGVGGGGW